MTITLAEWLVHEEKTRDVRRHIESRCEYLRYLPNQDFPPLLVVLKGILFYMETINFHGDYQELIKKHIEHLSSTDLTTKEIKNAHNPRKILKDLNRYSRLLQNDILTDFFSREEYLDSTFIKHYRIEPTFYVKNMPSYYVLLGKSALEILLNFREDNGEFHLKDPKQNVIEINKCQFVGFYKREDAIYCNVIGGECALVSSSKISSCPNIGNLVEREDTFERFIAGNYRQVDDKKYSLKPLSNS